MSADSRLIEAMLQGNLEAATAALDSGASPDARDAIGQTVLTAAISQRKPEIAMLLLDRGADPSLKGMMQRPVGAAASQGQLEIMRRLLAMNAQIDDDAAIFAKLNDHHEIVALLEAEEARRVAAAKAKAEAPVPPILAAGGAGDVPAIQAAVDAGAALDVVDDNGWTPLMLAAGRGHRDAVTALLAAKAPVTTGSLLAAVQSGDGEMVQTLARAGGDVSAPHASGMTPLLLACKMGHDAIVSLLLDLGAAPNGAAPAGSTPLMFAARAGSDAIATALLARGADVNQLDQDGSTALMGAAGGGHTAMVQRLLAAGARTDAVERQLGATALGAAGIGGNTEILALLLDAKMQPDAKNDDGFTALHYRAAIGDVASVTLLLARGASANAANNFNETPLLRAAAAGHAEVVTMLLDAGATIDHTSKDGFTALMLAADKGHLETAKILLARGADRTISNLALKRAADYARLAGHTDIEALLAPPPRELPKVTPRTVSSEEAKAASKRLIAACWSDDLDQAAAAIGDGAVIDGSGDDIPLLLAASSGSTDIVRLLLEQGATVDVADSLGLTALSKACGGCRVDMARALLEKGAAVTGDVVASASYRQHPGIMALLEAAPRV